MQKALTALIAIVLLLVLASLTLTNSNPTSINEMRKSPENFGQGSRLAQIDPMQDNGSNQMVEESIEDAMKSEESAEVKSLPEDGSIETENIQTLENQTQNDNVNPPDGRIYYPTSSEEPYAYTPTYTPKEANLPIIPTIPEN
jgi:hypothetical protein